MKTMHIHIGVASIEQSIPFYSALFGVEPVKVKSDYAKWALEDPKVNFAISTRVSGHGVDHLGIQVSDDTELAAMRKRIQDADIATWDEGETVCCYARSDKSWVTDPSGVAWETYHTMEDAEIYSPASRVDTDGACCVSSQASNSACC